jgi:rod shape-determining protein MreC
MIAESNRVRHWARWIVVSSIVFWSGYRFLIAPPPVFVAALSYVAYPFLVVQKSVVMPIVAWKSNKASVAQLHQELSKSRADFGQLMAENIALRTQLNYAENTQELRDFKARYSPEKMKIAQVIARHFSEQAHYYYLDLGASAHIELDMIVVYNNCLIGKVTEVYSWYCKVTLITDQACKVAAYCDSSKVRGIHEGINIPHSSYLKFVSHLATVTINDLVVSSGEGLVFPRGFALGKIKSSTADGLYQQVELEPVLDLETLDYCLILSKDVHEHVSLVPELPQEDAILGQKP